MNIRPSFMLVQRFTNVVGEIEPNIPSCSKYISYVKYWLTRMLNVWSTDGKIYPCLLLFFYFRNSFEFTGHDGPDINL